MSGKTESDSKEEAYADRNLAVAALALACARLGHTVSIFPSGQVSWHLPSSLASILGLPFYRGMWDGHDLEEKRRRHRRLPRRGRE